MTSISLTNLLNEHPAHPPQVVYKGDNQKCWSLDLYRWPGNLEPETEDNFKKVPVIFDLDKSAWLQIKDAVEKSEWIPEEYYMNDWLVDVCSFLIRGERQNEKESCFYCKSQKKMNPDNIFCGQCGKAFNK